MTHLHHDKSGGADRIQILHAVEIRKAMSLPDLVRFTGRSREYLASVLRGLEGDGLLDYDPSTSFYRLARPRSRNAHSKAS